MADKIELSLLEKHGWIEALSRQFFEKHPKIKKIIKKHREKTPQGNESSEPKEIPSDAWKEYKELLSENIAYGDILLIHSSADGLSNIGVTAEQCIDFLKKLVEVKNCTIVFACFPVTNLKPPTQKSRPYDPKKTLCWTGMLPNIFIADSECKRTRFPYNSLAAMGSKADEMMSHDLEAKLVYDRNSAWRYCLDRHAKILFLGVKASRSNTMAIHMLPDYMGEEWPIKGWYQENTYKVKLDDRVVEVPVIAQKGEWYKYVMEEGTSGRLKQAGILVEHNVKGCNFGIVQDSLSMMDFLTAEVRKGRLTYLIPKKFYKRHENRIIHVPQCWRNKRIIFKN